MCSEFDTLIGHRQNNILPLYLIRLVVAFYKLKNSLHKSLNIIKSNSEI